jgi:hypothetical protein
VAPLFSGVDAVRRRKLLVVLASAIATLLAASIFVMEVRRPQVSPENCRRITANMTHSEVEAMLGPPGDYTTGPVEDVGTSPEIAEPLQISPDLSERKVSWQSDRTVYWHGDNGIIQVSFDPTGHASYKCFVSATKLEQSLLGNLLWRVNRQWRKLFPE